MLGLWRLGGAVNFSTCSICKRQEIPKELIKNKLYREGVNRFTRDKGMRRQLEHLGLNRMDDALHPDLITSETDLESLRDESKKFRKEFKADEDPERVKRILIQKKLFPQPKPPNLLTSIEKETIRYLHQKDPHEWTVQRLSESFPVDTYGIKKILKSPGPKSLQSVQRLDIQAAESWKLLSKGKLEISNSLEEHLKAFPRKHVELSAGDKENIKQKLMLNFVPTKPKLLAGKGEFTRIIEDYEAKVGRQGEEGRRQQGPGEQIDLGQMQELFGGNTVEGTPSIHESSPYGETALLKTSIDLRREQYMDLEKFREVYLNKTQSTLPSVITKTLRPFSDAESKGSTLREAYAQWLRSHDEKSARVSKHIKKVDVDEVIKSELSDAGKEFAMHGNGPETIQVFYDKSLKTGQDEIFVFSEEKGSQSISNSASPDFIQIPENLKDKYNFFQVNDSVYDSDGAFVYRVPGLQK